MAPPSKPEPGRDAGMAVRARKLNVLFALTSIGMLVAFSLMIWDDYDREWKQYQKNFNRLEVKTTKEQAEQALGKMDASRREALQQELAKGKQEAEARRSDIAKAESEAGTLQGRWYGADEDHRFTKAEMDV